MIGAYEEDLAHIHDAGYCRLATAAGKVLVDTLHCRGFREGLVVDLGCGSGPLSEVVAGAGFGVLGVDISESLLDLARRRVPGATFMHGSLFDVEFPPAVGVACVGECLNYTFDPLNSDKAVAALFRRLHAALPPGGLFLFDALTTAHPQDGYRTWTSADGWAVLVDVRIDLAERMLTRDITTFRRVGEAYRRAREVHRQRLLDPDRLAALLRETGFRFRNLAAFGDMRLRKGHRAYLATKN